MHITVQFPAGVTYISSPVWFIDPTDGWTVRELCDDINYAVRVESHKLQLGGVDLLPDDVATEALEDGDTIALVVA